MFRYLLITLPLLGVSSTLEFVPATPRHESRIYNGRPVEIEEYPYNAPYTYTLRNNGVTTGFCSGTIVDEHYVVTAGHCVAFVEDPVDIDLRVGDTDRKYGTRTLVFEIILHPDYTSGSFVDYDVAMFRTEKMKFSNSVQPASLPPPDQEEINDILTVTGWGRTETDGSNVRELRVGDLIPIPPNWCKATFQLSSTDGLFCARPLNTGADAQQICEGDDGAPAVIEETMILQGIALPRKCSDDITALFVAVSDPSIRSFIEDTINSYSTVDTSSDNYDLLAALLGVNGDFFFKPNDDDLLYQGFGYS